VDLYLLRFPEGIHLGAGTGELARTEPLPRSDTLTAALLSVWRHVDPAAEIGELAKDPPFSVSSAIPWHRRAGSREAEWLLPLPPGAFDHLPDPKARKALRRVRHAAPGLLARALRGGAPDPDDPGLVMGGTLWLECPPPGEGWLYGTERTTRLAVDRLTGGPVSGMLFSFARTRFRWDASTEAGAGVLVELRRPELKPRFEVALELLGMEGLGGDRSVGLGHFEVVDRQPVTLPELGQGAKLLLSLTAPHPEALSRGLLDPPARYEIVERGGWVTSPGAATLRRRRLRMLAEGSLVAAVEGRLGRSVRVLDPIPELGLRHPVYRGAEPLALDVDPSASGSQP